METTIKTLRENLYNLRTAIEMGLVQATDNEYYDIGLHAGFMLNPKPSAESVEAAQKMYDQFVGKLGKG